MMHLTIVLLLVTAAHAGQEFEVASVKAGDPASPGSSSRTTPAGIEFRNATLKTLVRGAYGLNEYQLEGGPKWIDSARFNIDAKLPAGSPRDQMPLMMRALLADRFKLAFHRETKELKEYALVVAKGGAKLVASSEDDRARARSSQGDRMIKCFGMPVSTLAQMLISAVEAPVIDRTGITGQYNFDLKFAPLSAGADDPLPSIFAVLQDQLGLRLEAIKGPVEVLVIDGAERPAEN